MIDISGCTTIKESSDMISISYAGNMGNNIDNINRDLIVKNYPTIAQFKQKYPNYKENGFPSYWYEIIFYKD